MATGASAMNTLLADLQDLVDSGRMARAEDVAAALVTEPLVEILRAEIDIYFERIDKASMKLESLRRNINDIGLLARFALAEGELYWRKNRDDDCAARFQLAYSLYDFLNDDFGLARAHYGLARIAAKYSHYNEADEHFAQAVRFLEEISQNRKDYLLGLIGLAQGEMKHRQGKIDEATNLLLASVQMLGKTDAVRHYAVARCALAALYVESGRYDIAAESCDEAIQVLKSFNLNRELIPALSTRAEAQIGLKRYREAEAALEEARELLKANPNKSLEARVLTLLSDVYINTSRVKEAAAIAQNALDIADVAGNSLLRIQSRLRIGRLPIIDRQLRKQALEQSLEIAESTGNPSLKAEVLIASADFYFEFDLARGREYISLATPFVEASFNARLRNELKRVQVKSERMRIRRTEHELIFDARFLPTWEEAKHALETFLLKNALDQSQGNLTRAGEILDITKVHVHTKKKQLGL